MDDLIERLEQRSIPEPNSGCWIDDLITRLEAATGPDRKLDHDIWFLMDQPLDDHAVDCPLRYTESLDAALTLVPEGMGWGVKFDNQGHFAWVSGDIARNGQTVAVRYGWNAPLALCIASLKARALETNSQEPETK